MTKAEKISLLNEMLLIERVESAVTGSRLSILPFSTGAAVTQATNRAFAATGRLAKKKVAAKANSKGLLQRQIAKKAVKR